MIKLLNNKKIYLVLVIVIILNLVTGCSESKNNFAIQIIDNDISYSNDKFVINSIKFEDEENPNDLYFTIKIDNLNQDAKELRLNYLTINGIIINSYFYDYLEADTIEIINVVVNVEDLVVIGETNLSAFNLDFSFDQDDVSISLISNVISENNLLKINDDISYYYLNNNIYLLITNSFPEAKPLTIDDLAINNLMFSNTINGYLVANKSTLFRIKLDEFEVGFNDLKKIENIEFYYTIDTKKEAQINF